MDAPDIIVCYDGTLIVVTPENDVLSERWAAEACEVDETLEPRRIALPGISLHV